MKRKYDFKTSTCFKCKGGVQKYHSLFCLKGKIFPMNTIKANRLDIEKLRDEFAAEFIRLDKFRIIAGQLADVLRRLRKSTTFEFDEDRKIILKDTIEALDAYDEIARDDHTCKWSVGGCDQ